MAHTAQFTAAETAFVLREPIRAVKKALDAGPVRPVLLRRAGSICAGDRMARSLLSLRRAGAAR